MNRQKIAGIYADAEAFGGRELTVCGWVRTVRDMKNFGFIELNDHAPLFSTTSSWMARSMISVDLEMPEP